MLCHQGRQEFHHSYTNHTLLPNSRNYRPRSERQYVLLRPSEYRQHRLTLIPAYNFLLFAEHMNFQLRYQAYRFLRALPAICFSSQYHLQKYANTLMALNHLLFLNGRLQDDLLQHQLLP